MASEHKANRRESFVIMSSVSVVVFLSLVFTLSPFNQAYAGPTSPTPDFFDDFSTDKGWIAENSTEMFVMKFRTS